MNERPVPIKRYLTALFGKDTFPINVCHHGLKNADLKDIYPYLNLKETFDFAIGSRLIREDCPQIIENMDKTKDIVQLFDNCLSRANNCIRGEIVDKTSHYRLNPFDSDSLYERLKSLSMESVENLFSNLKEPTVNWVTIASAMRNSREGHCLEHAKILYFLPGKSIRKGDDIVQHYVKEVARLFREEYPVKLAEIL